MDKITRDEFLIDVPRPADFSIFVIGIVGTGEHAIGFLDHGTHVGCEAGSAL